MPDRLEGRLRWLFGGAAVAFAATGAPAAYGAFRAAQGSEQAMGFFVLAFVPVGIVLASALAALIAWEPRRFAHLMPLLALAAAAVAVLCLVLLGFAVASPAGDRPLAPLAGFVAAAAFATLVMSAWLALWLSPRPSLATVARDDRLLASLLSAMAPAGGPFALGAADPLVRASVTQYFAALHRRGATALRLVLRVLDSVSLVKHGTGLAELDPVIREAMIDHLAQSRFRSAPRHLGAALKIVVMTRFYSDERAQAQIGYDRDYVSRKLDEGPNRDAHRARLAAAAREAKEAQLEMRLDPVVAPAEERRAGDADDRSVAASPVREEPLDRPWTLGLASESVPQPLGPQVLRVVRTTGPTRP